MVLAPTIFVRMDAEAKRFLDEVAAMNSGESEFLQAVEEVVINVWDYYQKNPKYKKYKILERLVEPERVIMFRVPWVDDSGEVQVNRGFRVEFNSALGPYKGGLRFHPTVTLSGLKFLGFEQTFKNSLTSLQMGGGKGGSDFNPKGKSEQEVMRFCQSYMTELFRHIGEDTDIPAGDIGVGGREVGFLFGQYKRICNQFVGVITGKGREFGGSLIRPEATGYGAVYFVEEMLERIGDKLEGKTVGVSGFGNVAWGAAKKAVEDGAKVVTISGPDGYVYIEDGMTEEQIDYMLELRATNMDIVQPFAERFVVPFFEGEKPWQQKMDIALPCAIQNEMDANDVKVLHENGCQLIAEVSNMGLTPEAVDYAQEHVILAPGKAVNAGGVAVSGLEMSQNSMRLSWTAQEVDMRLREIMKAIHDTCVRYGNGHGRKVNYIQGANIGGFVKVADAMIAQGVV